MQVPLMIADEGVDRVRAYIRPRAAAARRGGLRGKKKTTLADERLGRHGGRKRRGSSFPYRPSSAKDKTRWI